MAMGADHQPRTRASVREELLQMASEMRTAAKATRSRRQIEIAELCEGAARLLVQAPACPLHGPMMATEVLTRSWYCVACGKTTAI